MTTPPDVLRAWDSYLPLILAHLPTLDVCRLAATSRSFHRASLLEFRRRAETWIATTSRAWSFERTVDQPWGPDEVETSADATGPDDAEALNQLEEAWRNLGTPRRLLEELAAFCGGWPQLLLARERGAPPQPRLARGRPVEFTTLGELGWDESGELYTLPCPVALFFDVYCRDRSGWTHKWSGVHPLKSTYTTFTIPFSANSLGDKTTNATFYHHEAFECLPRYFFSADHDDERQWRFNVSAVTSRSAETLLLSSEMVPSKVVQAIEKKNLWEKDGGYGEFLREKKNFEGVIRSGKYNSMYSKSISRGRHRFNSKFQDKNLWRAYEERPDDPYGDRSIPSVTVKGIDWEGNVRDIDYPHYEMNYWLEKRVDGNDQLHMTLAFECEHMFWSDVMLRCSSERGVIGERLIKRSRLN